MKRPFLLELLAIVYLAGKTQLETLAAEPTLDRKLLNVNVRIGFGSDCFLFWKGSSGETKNGEFRCESSDGDSFWVEKVATGYLGGDLYKIFTDVGGTECPLYWRGDRHK